MALLVVEINALLFDFLKLVVLCTKHVHISYDTRVPKVVEGVVNDKMRGAAGMEYGVVCVLDFWTMEVGGWVRTCMERGAIDGLVFAFCSLMDDPVID